MASSTANKIPGFAHQPLWTWKKPLKAAQATQPEGAILIVDATPTTFIEGADTSGAKSAGVLLNRCAAGEDAECLHPNSGIEVGPYQYVPGSATDALVGRQVCVVDNQSVNLTANTTNKVIFGRITRIFSADKVYVQLKTEISDSHTHA